MTARRYIQVWLGSVLATLLCAAVLNIVVDPYDVFGTTRHAGLNAHKPTAATHTALTKAFQIERVSPRTVLLGTSRIDIGLDPDHPDWPTAAQPVYNYGFPSASILTMQQQVKHALQAGPLQLAIVGLEFHDFLRPPDAPKHEPTEAERRFLAMARSQFDVKRTRQVAIDLFNASLTLKASMDSVVTVAQQRRGNVGGVTNSGLTSEAPYAGLVRADGQHALFEQKDLDVARSRAYQAQSLSSTSPDSFHEMAQVRALIEYCREQNIALTLFVPPYHAHYFEIVDASGLWDRFENWKIALTSLVEEYQGAGDGPSIVLWDFASYDEFTTEAVPAKDQRGVSMKWFWEPLHYKKALGDLALSRMLGTGGQGFGTKLSSHTISEHLASGREQRGAYRQRLPDEVANLQALARNARDRLESTSPQR